MSVINAVSSVSDRLVNKIVKKKKKKKKKNYGVVQLGNILWYCPSIVPIGYTLNCVLGGSQVKSCDAGWR